MAYDISGIGMSRTVAENAHALSKNAAPQERISATLLSDTGNQSGGTISRI